MGNLIKLKNIIPNSLSMANCLLGFFILIFTTKLAQDPSQKNVFFIIVLLMVIAALVDKLDGLVARMLKINNPIGTQLDSLADVITFGITPAFLFYVLHFHQFTIHIYNITFPIGMFLAAVYPVCAVYRLARFNISSKSQFFVGLPSPIAALALLCLCILFFHKNDIINLSPTFITVLFILISFLMISRIKFMKTPNFMEPPLNYIRIILLITVLIVACVYLDWFWILLILVMSYLCSGLYIFIISFIQTIKISLVSTKEDKL